MAGAADTPTASYRLVSNGNPAKSDSKTFNSDQASDARRFIDDDQHTWTRAGVASTTTNQARYAKWGNQAVSSTHGGTSGT